MPVYHSLQMPVLESKVRSVNRDFNDLFLSVTEKILLEKPNLVLEVAEGKLEKSALDKEVIRIIDQDIKNGTFIREDIIKKVNDFMFGYGRLQEYIDDEDVSDIDGTSYNCFSVKRNGVREKVSIDFGSERFFDTYCKLIAIRNNGILNENDNHCRVTDERNKLRINLSVRPRSSTGPNISIRKHRQKSYAFQDLVNLGMINEEIKELLAFLAKGSATLVFCGKGAAGKTTLLRAFIEAMPEMERVLIAESDTEIYPEKSYCIQHKIKKNNEGGIVVTLQDLVRDGLTMSLDTYVIGEMVGSEAWEFIKASFSGHRCAGTIHAESAKGAFPRLMALARGDSNAYSEKLLCR